MASSRPGSFKNRAALCAPSTSWCGRRCQELEPPEFLFCPVKRRSYASNAAQHVGAKELRMIDIKAYFPSTPRQRVIWFFHKVMRCSPDVAVILGQLLTADGHLTTGSTVSPIMSFFAFYDMWLAIAQIAKDAGCVLTVYMDDITISCDRIPGKVVWAIKQEIHRRGLNYHKERRYTRGIGEVTGESSETVRSSCQTGRGRRPTTFACSSPRPRTRLKLCVSHPFCAGLMRSAGRSKDNASAGKLATLWKNCS